MKQLQLACPLILSALLVACGSDTPGSETSAAPSATPASQKAASSTPTDEVAGSQVSFDYSGDFEGTASTSAVIAGLMTDELTGITASLDGYSSQSDTLTIGLRNEDFVVGEPTDIFVEDRNTLTLTMDGYALQVQPGSSLTVLEKSDTTFRAEANELVLTGYEIMDFQREKAAKTVTIANLVFNYVK